MVKGIWKLVTPIISAIIGIYATNTFNVFALLPFVPDEHLFDICITVYFAIADIIIELIAELITKSVKNFFTSELEVIMGVPGANTNLTSNAIMTFNSQSLAEAIIKVNIRGRKKHFKGVELVIKKPAFAEMQAVSSRREVYVDDEYHVNLEALFGNGDRIESKQEFRIALIQDAVDGNTEATIYPELSIKKCNIIFKRNSAKLRTGRE